MDKNSQSDSSIQDNKSKKQDKISLNKFLEMKQKSEQLVMQDKQSEADDDTWGRLESVAFSQSDAFMGGLNADDENPQEQEGQEYGYDDDYESVVSLVLNNATEHTALCQLQTTSSFR